MPGKRAIMIATRGSALALAQANLIAEECRRAFPRLRFELKIIKTTGDKLQSASLLDAGGSLPKGLFTKELEVALADKTADLAVHSLKDLPTDLPEGLILAATPLRGDVRDVLIYRDVKGTGGIEGKLASGKGFKPHTMLRDLPAGTVIATSSTRRKMQMLVARRDVKVVEIRGNVPTRLQKVAAGDGLEATILALAGLTRLNYEVHPDGRLTGEGVPDGLLATVLDLDVMLPCVGQGAIGVEIRAGDKQAAEICAKLNHVETFHAVTAERAFLSGMGGGCLSPVAAYAEVTDEKILMWAVSFQGGRERRGDGELPATSAAELGAQLAVELKS